MSQSWMNKMKILFYNQKMDNGPKKRHTHREKKSHHWMGECNDILNNQSMKLNKKKEIES